MFRHEAGCGRRRRRASCVAGALRLAADLTRNPFEIGLNEAPGAHVLGLLLTPDDFRILEARKLSQERLGREWIKLLDAQKVDVIDAALFALVLGERDLLTLMCLRMIPEQSVETGVRAEGREVGHRAPVAQHRLRRHQDEGLAELTLELAAQHMEEIRRRCAL